MKSKIQQPIILISASLLILSLLFQNCSGSLSSNANVDPNSSTGLSTTDALTFSSEKVYAFEGYNTLIITVKDSIPRRIRARMVEKKGSDYDPNTVYGTSDQQSLLGPYVKELRMFVPVFPNRAEVGEGVIFIEVTDVDTNTLIRMVPLSFMMPPNPFPKKQCSAGNEQVENDCVPQVCVGADTLKCGIGDAVGERTCRPNGKYSLCSNLKCDLAYGFNQTLGKCVFIGCGPGVELDCARENGTGTRVCAADGKSISACTIKQCDAGYRFENQKCVKMDCTPNAKLYCEEAAFVGEKICDSEGRGYGSCQFTRCHKNFHRSNGVCLPGECVQGAEVTCTEQYGSGIRRCDSTNHYGSCELKTCINNYMPKEGKCVQNYCNEGQKVPCQEGTVAPSVPFQDYLNTGEISCQTAPDGGRNWGQCRFSSCSLGFELETGTMKCIASAPVCEGTFWNGLTGAPYYFKFANGEHDFLDCSAAGSSDPGSFSTPNYCKTNKAARTITLYPGRYYINGQFRDVVGTFDASCTQMTDELGVVWQRK